MMKLKFIVAIVTYNCCYFKSTVTAFVILSNYIKLQDYNSLMDHGKCQMSGIGTTTQLHEANNSAATSAMTSKMEDSDTQDQSLNEMILQRFEKYYPRTPQQKLLTFILTDFKPLGLTAEESLAQKDTNARYHHVFVSKVLENGFADKAGIKVGDVIVGVSGLFGTTECVVGESLEKVKGMITSQNKNDNSGDDGNSKTTSKALVIKVIRGSLVMNDHESAIVDLCTLPENELNVEQCIEALYQRDYEIKTSSVIDEGPTLQCNDSETECMLDMLFSTWNESYHEEDKATSNIKEEEKQKPAPWSSRSSPSGTFVRDPNTGKMINIDD